VFLAYVGAVLLGVGAFGPWLAATGGHAQLTGRDIRVHDLLYGLSGHATRFRGSAALVLVIAALVILLGAVYASRFLVFLGLLVGGAVIVDWIVREALRKAPAHFGVADLRLGSWLVLAGVVLGFIGFVALRRRVRVPEEQAAEQWSPF
jgi:hypothetical protein